MGRNGEFYLATDLPPSINVQAAQREVTTPSLGTAECLPKFTIQYFYVICR